MTSEKYEINFEDECGRCADNTQKPHPETCTRSPIQIAVDTPMMLPVPTLDAVDTSIA